MLRDYRRCNILFLSPLPAWQFNPGTHRARQPAAQTHHTMYDKTSVCMVWGSSRLPSNVKPKAVALSVQLLVAPQGGIARGGARL